MSSRIEDYALIGDTRGAGLVSKSGSIDWLCIPRFDSGACFAALLGTPEHGRWLIAPHDAVQRVTRRYQGDSLVLETVLETAHGEVALIDCMVFDEKSEHVQVIRVVEGRRGRVKLHMDLTVRFDYGSIVPWVTHEDHCWRFVAGPDTLRLHSDIPLRGHGLHTVGEMEVSEGDRLSFMLEHHESHLSLPPLAATRPACDLLAASRANWHAWSARSKYQGQYPEAVLRSLLVLKALTYGPTGGIVAAPTTSLPEYLGGKRNWDYRYCWLRDATITLYALVTSGYQEEARAFRAWLMRAVAGSPAQVQVMYSLSGERRLQESELDWLPGYEGSRPVRIGNAAHTQLQLDVFGELLDAMHQCRRQGLESAASWALERALLQHLEERWAEPDEGIWEVRGPRRKFTYSKVMTWVAFDRGVKAIEEFGCKGPLERFRQIRDEIHRDVCEHGFDRNKNTFTHWYGSDDVDASLLLIPLVGFLPPDDPRVQGTLAAVERELLIDDTFVLRYRTTSSLDGLPKGEGAFLACSFWLVSNYVMQGREQQARELFERLLALRNDVGLLAEEYDPDARRMLGNFPQAFSHLALVDAAQALSQGRHAPPEHRLAPERTPK